MFKMSSQVGNSVSYASSELCLYQRHSCSRPRYQKYKYCVDHILEDETSPFTSCEYMSRTSGRKCPNPALRSKRANVLPSFCDEHLRDLIAKEQHQKRKKKLRKKRKNEKIQESNSLHPKKQKLINRVAKIAQYEPKTSAQDSSDSETEAVHRPITDGWVVETSEDLANNADWDDFDPVNNEVYEPLRYADVLTPEEVVATAQSKLIRLQSLYIEQFKRLFHLLKERRRQYLYNQKKEIKHERISKDLAEEFVDEEEIHALANYRKRTGVEALLRKRQKRHRLEFSAGMMNNSEFSGKLTTVQSRCSHASNHMRCRLSCLPYTKYCSAHIMEDPHQLLYKKCHSELCPNAVCYLTSRSYRATTNENQSHIGDVCYCSVHAPLPEMTFQFPDERITVTNMEIEINATETSLYGTDPAKEITPCVKMEIDELMETGLISLTAVVEPSSSLGVISDDTQKIGCVDAEGVSDLDTMLPISSSEPNSNFETSKLEKVEEKTNIANDDLESRENFIGSQNQTRASFIDLTQHDGDGVMDEDKYESKENFIKTQQNMAPVSYIDLTQPEVNKNKGFSTTTDTKSRGEFSRMLSTSSLEIIDLMDDDDDDDVNEDLVKNENSKEDTPIDKVTMTKDSRSVEENPTSSHKDEASHIDKEEPMKVAESFNSTTTETFSMGNKLPEANENISVSPFRPVSESLAAISTKENVSMQSQLSRLTETQTDKLASLTESSSIMPIASPIHQPPSVDVNAHDDNLPDVNEKPTTDDDGNTMKANLLVPKNQKELTKVSLIGPAIASDTANKKIFDCVESETALDVVSESEVSKDDNLHKQCPEQVAGYNQVEDNEVITVGRLKPAGPVDDRSKDGAVKDMAELGTPNINNNCSTEPTGLLQKNIDLVESSSDLESGETSLLSSTMLPVVSSLIGFRGERKPSSADEEMAVVSLLSLCTGHPSDDNAPSSSTDQE